jgi:hypothetical protein
MSDENSALRDALWGMYQENTTQARHHEDQRSTVASTLIAIAGAVIGLITFQKSISVWDIPLTVLLMAIGGFGAVFSAKQYERFSLHMERARTYRDALDVHLDGSPLKPLKVAADARTAKDFPKLTGLRLHYFWLALYGLILLMGIVLTGLAMVYPTPPETPAATCACAAVPAHSANPAGRRDAAAAK